MATNYHNQRDHACVKHPTKVPKPPKVTMTIKVTMPTKSTLPFIELCYICYRAPKAGSPKSPPAEHITTATNLSLAETRLARSPDEAMMTFPGEDVEKRRSVE